MRRGPVTCYGRELLLGRRGALPQVVVVIGGPTGLDPQAFSGWKGDGPLRHCCRPGAAAVAVIGRAGRPWHWVVGGSGGRFVAVVHEAAGRTFFSKKFVSAGRAVSGPLARGGPSSEDDVEESYLIRNRNSLRNGVSLLCECDSTCYPPPPRLNKRQTVPAATGRPSRLVRALRWRRCLWRNQLARREWASYAGRL